ncbi:MAG: terminase small subunit [Desulfamplus sp.]|nr:terminase small subunit [Desulfamplus sp.]
MNTTAHKATSNPNSKHLTAKQMAFIDLYDGNTTRTAVAAGYGVKSAKMAGIRNMQNVTIRNLIEQRQSQEIKPKVMDRIARQVFWSDITRDDGLPLRDRLRASELLGRSEGDFLERVHQDVNMTPPTINIVWGDHDQ